MLRDWIIKIFKHTLEHNPEKIRTYATDVEIAHGRIEKREISVLSAGSEQLSMPGIKQIAILRRYRKVKNTNIETDELTYLVTDMSEDKLSAEQFYQIKRDYWLIENKLHYIKDFVFNEDRCTIRKDGGPQNMSSIRNFALSVMLASGVENVKRFVDNVRHDFTTFMQHAFIF